MSLGYDSKILIVEDEVKIALLLADYLKSSSYQVKLIHRGDEVEDWLVNNDCELILLDLMLPGIDGLEVCKRVRHKSDVPIIMVTAKVEEIDRLIGLELGADDYICKPFSPREVVARVKAVLRRRKPHESTLDSQIQLDPKRFKVISSQGQCELTKVEFLLFQALFSSPGRIYSRGQLMDFIYDDKHLVSDRTIDSHVKKLRKKLAVIGIDEGAVHSVYGAGYKYEL